MRQLLSSYSVLFAIRELDTRDKDLVPVSEVIGVLWIPGGPQGHSAVHHDERYRPVSRYSYHVRLHTIKVVILNLT